MKIKTLRKIVQVIFFILIIYGGYIIASVFDVKVLALGRGQEGEINLVDFPLPVRSCRYIEPKPTLFQSCSVRYLVDTPFYQPSWPAIGLTITILLILYFSLSRLMCGWLCPLGFITDMLDYIRQKLRIDKVALPEKLRNFLKYWRYSFLLFLVFMAVAIILPFAYGIYMDKNFYALACQLCPARTILPFFNGRIPILPTFMTPITSIFSTLSIIFFCIYLSGLFITRSWCRICPNGTLSSLFSKGALIVKEKDVQKCTRCGICKRVCPFENNHVLEEKVNRNVNHPNCIMCFNCVEKCPEKDCLHITFLGKKIYSSRMRDMTKEDKYE